MQQNMQTNKQGSRLESMHTNVDKLGQKVKKNVTMLQSKSVQEKRKKFSEKVSKKSSKDLGQMYARNLTRI